MKKVFGFFSNVKLAIFAAGVVVVLIALAVIQVDTWVRVNPKVKKIEKLESLLSKCDSLVFVQDRQLTVFNEEVNDYVLQILNDSIRHRKDIAIHQANNKELLRRNSDLDKLLAQYDGKGACRYPEDSIYGKWPNRKTVTVWRTKPCVH